MAALLKKGAITVSDTGRWHLEIDFFSALLNCVIWLVILILVAWGYDKLRRKSGKEQA
jgi:hypothetical protein